MITLLMVGLLAFAAGAAGAQESGARGDAGSAPVREARLAEGKFIKGSPLPAWVRPLSDPPPTSRTNPVVIRLAETQLNVAPEACLVHRAIQVNSTSTLGQIGQLPISFAPEYQRELMLAEAWFYFGQHHLVDGDKVRAKEAFEKALEKKIVVYIEHLAAGFELVHLR